MSIKEKVENFYERVKVFRVLLLESRNRYSPEIERNQDKIKEERKYLIREYAKLEKYIKKFGKNTKMNDGVWNIWYSPYDNAFTNDILQRVGPSLDAVINDLDWIIGKLEDMPKENIDNKDHENHSVAESILESKDLLIKIDNSINLAEQKLLKGEELNQLVSNLKNFIIADIGNEILKRKIEKIQREPNTVWSDSKGYAIGGDKLLAPWKELFLELQVGPSDLTQKYFRPGSREEIYEYLKTLIPGAQTIKIYDNYLDEEILHLLELCSKDADIFILGKLFKQSFNEKIEAFKIYFEKKIQAKKINISHARFYIIDGNVFSVDTSLAGEGADKATMISPVVKKEADKIVEDYEQWWLGTKDIVI